jgi:hypothetical protein
MEKYVPLEKRSKKEQRAWHARQRGNWNGVKPVTRIVPSKKVYSRKKKRQEFPPDVFLFASPVVGTNVVPHPPLACGQRSPFPKGEGCLGSTQKETECVNAAAPSPEGKNAGQITSENALRHISPLHK